MGRIGIGVAAVMVLAAGMALAEGTTAAKPGKVAARWKACGAEWRAAKAAGTVTPGETWPQYLHDCNTRLKAAGG
jgi:hypothetical protein